MYLNSTRQFFDVKISFRRLTLKTQRTICFTNTLKCVSSRGVINVIICECQRNVSAISSFFFFFLSFVTTFYVSRPVVKLHDNTHVKERIFIKKMWYHIINISTSTCGVRIRKTYIYYRIYIVFIERYLFLFLFLPPCNQNVKLAKPK